MKASALDLARATTREAIRVMARPVAKLATGARVVAKIGARPVRAAMATGRRDRAVANLAAQAAEVTIGRGVRVRSVRVVLVVWVIGRVAMVTIGRGVRVRSA